MRRWKKGQDAPKQDAKPKVTTEQKAPAGTPDSKPETKAPKAPKSRHREIWYTRWLGLLLCCAGFVAIAIGWSGMSTAVSADAQLPYLLSGGAGGLGLIIFGATLLVISQMRADRFRHEDALGKLLSGRPSQRDDSEERTPASDTESHADEGAESMSTASMLDRTASAFTTPPSSSSAGTEADTGEVPAASGIDR
jgi:hypothetical protein